MSDDVVARMAGLEERFGKLPDPRSSINRRHSLVHVVAMSVCGVLAGADGPTAIFICAHCSNDWLIRYLDLPHGIPSKDCIRRVLMRLHPQALQQCFAE